jgi:hypothetical protein
MNTPVMQLHLMFVSFFEATTDTAVGIVTAIDCAAALV